TRIVRFRQTGELQHESVQSRTVFALADSDGVSARSRDRPYRQNLSSSAADLVCCVTLRCARSVPSDGCTPWWRGVPDLGESGSRDTTHVPIPTRLAGAGAVYQFNNLDVHRITTAVVSGESQVEAILTRCGNLHFVIQNRIRADQTD